LKTFLYRLGAIVVAVTFTAMLLTTSKLETKVERMGVEQHQLNQTNDSLKNRLDTLQGEVERLRETHPYQSRK